MQMPDHDYYIRLIPSHHRQQPLFRATVGEMTEGPWSVGQSMRSWDLHFQLETAVGHQLDILGEWIGISRTLQVAIHGVYFSWDDLPELGWYYGVWRGRFDATTGLGSLNDDDYRRLLYTMIMVNNWDGSLSQLHAIWQRFLPEGVTGFIQDNQDMTYSIGYLGPELQGIHAALAALGAYIAKPMAVRIRAYLGQFEGSHPLLVWNAGPYIMYLGVLTPLLLGAGMWSDWAIIWDDDIFLADPPPFSGWGFGAWPVHYLL